MMNLIYSHLPLLQIFLMVAEKGSFQSAANELGLPRSSVSKKIQQLEQVLAQPLFKRTTRKLTITEFGMALRHQASELPDLVARVHQLVDNANKEVVGRVSISASVLLGQQFLVPLLTRLRRDLPKVEFDVSFNDEYVDLVEDKVDIALRVGVLPDSSLVAKQVGVKTHGWFASPDYIVQNGEPTVPSELLQHACLVCKSRFRIMDSWAFAREGEVTQSYQVNATIATDNSRALVDMAQAGLGIAMLDPLIIQEELRQGQLVPVLQDWFHPDNQPINLVSLSRGQRNRAVEEVWRYLADHLVVQ